MFSKNQQEKLAVIKFNAIWSTINRMGRPSELGGWYPHPTYPIVGLHRASLGHSILKDM